MEVGQRSVCLCLAFTRELSAIHPCVHCSLLADAQRLLKSSCCSR